MASAAATMDTLGPLFYPLLRASTSIARPILGLYDRKIGQANVSLANALVALSIAAAIRSCRTVAAWSASQSAKSSSTLAHANGSAENKGKGKIAKGPEQSLESDTSKVGDNGNEETDAAIAIGVLHIAFVLVLSLAAMRSAPLSGQDNDQARSLALVTSLGVSFYQALQWFYDDEPAPVAIASTTHCLGLTLGLFPLGGAARHLRYAAILASVKLQEPYGGLLPQTAGLYIGRALLILAGFLLVVGLTAIGLSFGRWEQFRRLEYQIAVGILTTDLIILTLIEFC